MLHKVYVDSSVRVITECRRQAGRVLRSAARGLHSQVMCLSPQALASSGINLGPQSRLCGSAASPAQGGSLLRWRPFWGLSWCLHACRTPVTAAACSRPPPLWQQPQQLPACWQVGFGVTAAHPTSHVAPCLTSVWPAEARLDRGEDSWAL